MTASREVTKVSGPTSMRAWVMARWTPRGIGPASGRFVAGGAGTGHRVVEREDVWELGVPVPGIAAGQVLAQDRRVDQACRSTGAESLGSVRGLADEVHRWVGRWKALGLAGRCRCGRCSR